MLRLPADGSLTSLMARSGEDKQELRGHSQQRFSAHSDAASGVSEISGDGGFVLNPEG
jgi:hypothetical protein